MIEFFTDPDGAIIMRTNEGKITLHQEFSEENTEITETMLNTIYHFYPDAYKMLKEEMSHIPPGYKKHFAMVHRFISCNFGLLDGTPDITEDGTFNLEDVPCPLRRFCKGDKVICKPKYQPSNMTNRQVEIISAIVTFSTEQEVADSLFISRNTLKNHKQRIFNSTGATNAKDLIVYALKNKMNPINK